MSRYKKVISVHYNTEGVVKMTVTVLKRIWVVNALRRWFYYFNTMDDKLLYNFDAKFHS